MRRLHNFRAVQPLWSEPFASHPLHHWKKVHIPESNGPAQRARHSLNAFIPPTAQSCLSLGRAIETSLLYQNQQCPPPEAASCRRVASLWLQNHRTEWLTVECSSTCVCSWKRWSLWAHVVILRMTFPYSELQRFGANWWTFVAQKLSKENRLNLYYTCMCQINCSFCDKGDTYNHTTLCLSYTGLACILASLQL